MDYIRLYLLHIPDHPAGGGPVVPAVFSQEAAACGGEQNLRNRIKAIGFPPPSCGLPPSAVSHIGFLAVGAKLPVDACHDAGCTALVVMTVDL